jgi:hypothetical protein
MSLSFRLIGADSDSSPHVQITEDFSVDCNDSNAPSRHPSAATALAPTDDLVDKIGDANYFGLQYVC